MTIQWSYAAKSVWDLLLNPLRLCMHASMHEKNKSIWSCENLYVSLLSANPTKWSNTLKQFVWPFCEIGASRVNIYLNGFLCLIFLLQWLWSFWTVVETNPRMNVLHRWKYNNWLLVSFKCILHDTFASEKGVTGF